MQKSNKRMPLPGRAIFGALLCSAVLALATAFIPLGAVDAPTAENYRFTRGTSFAPGEEARLKGFVSQLASEERILFRITGHTGTKGDHAANMNLSQTRADAVRDILFEMGIEPSRINWSGGVAGGAPLERDPDESEREWERSLARVTIEAVVQP